jgi:hypothetical protein
MVEANYEFEHNAADEGTPAILRRQEYWTMLSGAAGQLYGNGYTWPFRPGWESHLDTPGSAQIAYVKSLFAPRPWYNLIPDQDHRVVTAGYGTYSDSGSLAASDYLTAARTPDGAWILAYMPTRRTITVDMSKLGSLADASWYDPTNGASSSIAGSPFPNSGSRASRPGQQLRRRRRLGPRPASPLGSARHASPLGAHRIVCHGSQRLAGDPVLAPSSDDVAVSAYLVYRDGALVRSTRSTTITDTGLTPATTYAYTVAALDYADNLSAPLGAPSRHDARAQPCLHPAELRHAADPAEPGQRDLHRGANRRQHEHPRDRMERRVGEHHGGRGQRW